MGGGSGWGVSFVMALSTCPMGGGGDGWMEGDGIYSRVRGYLVLLLASSILCVAMDSTMHDNMHTSMYARIDGITHHI